MTRTQIRRATRARLTASGLSRRAFVRSLKLSQGITSHFSAFLDDGFMPYPQLVRALGYRRITPSETYQRAG